MTRHHCPDGMARHSPCALSGVGAAADTTLSLGLGDRDSNSKRFRKRPVSWWVTQVGHGPQGSCPPKGRPPDKTLCEACSSGPSWLALDGVWGARDTHREVI